MSYTQNRTFMGKNVTIPNWVKEPKNLVIILGVLQLLGISLSQINIPILSFVAVVFCIIFSLFIIYGLHKIKTDAVPLSQCYILLAILVGLLFVLNLITIYVDNSNIWTIILSFVSILIFLGVGWKLECKKLL